MVVEKGKKKLQNLQLGRNTKTDWESIKPTIAGNTLKGAHLELKMCTELYTGFAQIDYHSLCHGSSVR